MKLLKKVSVTTGLIFMLAFAAACGEKKAADAAPQETPVEETQQPKEMTPEERYAAMNEFATDVTSMDAKIIMDMDLTIADQSIASVTEMRMTTFVDPLKMRVQMNMDMGEQGSQTMEIYAEVTEDNKGMIYMYDGTSWTSQESPDITAALEQYDARNSVKVYVDGISGLVEAGRETVDGREIVKLTGELTGEDLKQSIMETGSLDSLSGLVDEEQLASIFDGLENENSYAEFWVDAETNEMIQYTQDMTNAMNKLYENMEVLLPQDSGIEMSVDKMVVTIKDITYNNVEDFTVPEEAKQQ